MNDPRSMRRKLPGGEADSFGAMTASLPNPYLRTKVMTAPPAELRLMLIDGAIKFSRQAADAIGHEDWEKMHESLVRAQKIILELINGLNPQVDPDLCGKLSALYNYLHGQLVEANLQRDPDPVQGNETNVCLTYPGPLMRILFRFGVCWCATLRTAHAWSHFAADHIGVRCGFSHGFC